IHIDELAVRAKKGARDAGGAPMIFNTITVSDGISMGTDGMRYSLPSRDLIADSIETVVGAENLDAVVTIGGCDKNMPGCMLASPQNPGPCTCVDGGTIRPRKHRGKHLDRVSVCGGVGQYNKGDIDEEQLSRIVRNACRLAGSCG